MANIKITDLSAIADPISTDVLPIVDVSADTTNKISIEDLLKNAAAGTAAAPAFAFDADPDTGMYRSGANALAFSTGGTEKMQIDSSGRLLVGTSSSRSQQGIQALAQVEHTDYSGLSLIVNNTNDNTCPVILMGKSKGSAKGSSTVVSTNSRLGVISFQGADGTDIESAAATIECRVDGNPGANDMPGRLEFRTTADGATSSTERMRIDSSGRVGIGTESPTGYIHIEGESTGTETYGRFTTGPANGDQSLVIKSGSSRDHMAIQVKTNAGAVDDLSLQPDGGNVGIGTAAPATKLHVLSSGDTIARITSADGNGAFLDLGDASDPDGGRIVYDSGSNLAFNTASIERGRFDNSGRLLVGVSSSIEANSQLQVVGSDVNGSIVIGRNDASVSNNQLIGRIQYYGNDSNGTYQLCAAVDAVADGDHGNNDKPTRLVFSTTADAASSPTERMQIDSAGRVGIGTASPTSLLFIRGGAATATISSSTNTANLDLINSTQTTRLGATNTDFAITHNGSERMRIDSSGRLLVGTSTARNKVYNGTTSTNVPQFQTEVSGSGVISRAMITGNPGTNTSDVGPALILARSAGTTDNSYTAVTSTANHLGAVSFQGADGSEFVEGARIEALVDGTPGANDMPTRLVFSTTADGGSSPLERVRIDSGGKLRLQQAQQFEYNTASTDSRTWYLNNDVHAYGDFAFRRSTTQTGATFETRILFKDHGGICFNGDTAEANALDDYEEGSWTPTLTGATTSPTLTYSSKGGRYEKIGALIHCSFFMHVSSVTTQGSGQLRISGLPFNANSNVAAGEVPAVLLQSEPFTVGDGANRWQFARTVGNSSYMLVGYKDLTTGGTAIPTSGASNVGGGYFIGHVTYRVN